uniref:Phosphatidylinositol 4-kinase beta n=1 Tax=Panagrolaimus superbus TaxID=310955 RepID=A0A914YQF5_9BILA
MFGRQPVDECNHSSTGLCSKCVLRDTFNLSTESADSAQNASYFQQNNTSTTILSFDELLQLTASSSSGTMPKFLPSSYPNQSPATKRATFSFEEDQEHQSPTESAEEELFKESDDIPTEEMVADAGYTSLASINSSQRRITEGDETDESAFLAVKKNLQEKQSLLLRLFESPHFDINLAMKYLFISRETGILSYLGNFPPNVVDFYLPQLITLYINMPNVAQALHCYILKRCSKSVMFALECFWLLEAYDVELFRKQSNKVHGYHLRQKILQDFLSECSSRPNSRTSFHTRSKSDAKVANGVHPSPTTMPRSDSAASVRSIQGAPGDLKTGKAFDDGCCCTSENEPFECICVSNSKIRPEMEFVKALMNIGNKLKFIPLKSDKSRQLVYELFMLNLNLPARVCIPMYANTIEHFVVRIPHTSGCVLNSKDKAPYCIYIEVVEVKSFYDSKIPVKLSEGSNFVTSSLPGLNIHPSSNSTLDSFTGNAVFQTQISQELENLSMDDGENDKLTQFDKLFVDDSYIESSSQISVDSEDNPKSSATAETSASTLNPAEIRQRLSELKKKKRKKMEHCPEDPSASAMSEPWEEKLIRIRESSPYGVLEGWKLLPVIVKTGDDLRQELLAYQLLTTLQKIWKEEKLPLYLRPYKILVYSSDSGMIEPILNACSLHQIKKNLVANPSYDDADQPYPPTLLSHFLITYAYSLACYFLQVKDRHNGNIMIDSDGHLIHIDFGYILSISPRNLGFETSPFKFTQELIDVIGGLNSDMFEEFKQLMLKGSQLPCFRGGPTLLKQLYERFHLSYTEPQLQELISGMVENSRDSLTTRLYDNFQYYTNGIF